MNIQNMKISTRLYLALSVILALMAILAWEAVTQTHALWMQTKMMYDHPLQVRRAVGSFKNEITGIQRDMRGLILAAGNDQDIAVLLGQIEAAKTDALKQLEILETHYLGPVADIKIMHKEFVLWNTIRDETIRLMRQGEVQEAYDRIKPDGIGGSKAIQLHELVDKVDEFARNKSDMFYREAALLKDRLNQELYLYAGVILFIVLLIAYALSRWIKEPLQQITAASDRFRQGDMEARSDYAFANEFGVMSKAFNAMAHTVAAEIHLRDKVGQLTAATAKETEARAFCQEMLASLIDQTGSQIGAVYLLNQ